MPNACVSLWPTEECEWSTWDIWRSSDVIEHAIYLILALTLGYTFFALTRFLFRYFLRRHELRHFSTGCARNDRRNQRMLISELSKGLGILRGIASAAPFLGLAGTSYGILCALWFSYSGSPERYVALLFTRIAFASTTTLAGIFVALSASIFHSLLRGRIENFPVASFLHASSVGRVRSFRFAETLALKEKFSSLPPFALLAAPTLACVVLLFTPFHPYRVPVGLRVLLPAFPCHPEVQDRIIVLRVTEKGELFINRERVTSTDLPERLAPIYRLRTERDLYLLADSGASFQMVADAIDTATTIRRPEFNALDLNVFLITPKAEAESEKCFTTNLAEARRQFLRK
ncbi:MAG TPA: MotA/TolQ/ExbB proton channel family protein [Dongiaceae bacterium]|nr:MotA/TolQ/ExbB proton channel family protein [Dongiaceae bacterium]